MSTLVAPKLSAPATIRYRIDSVDLLRGLIMIIMALDHVRDFFTNAQVDPTDPTKSWPALFFTRWITHLCAPGFIALAGTSVFLQRHRGRSANRTASRLVTRGLWLIFLEFAVVSPIIVLGYTTPVLTVFWVIGLSMIVLAALQYLPVRWVGAYGAIILCFHNLLNNVDASRFGRFANLWIVLYQRGPVQHNGHLLAIVAYPLVPWSAVMALGYAFGALVVLTPQRRQRLGAVCGAVFLALFAVLRLINRYGDPFPWKHLGTATRTAMSFFGVRKYPPSLQFLLATWGILLLLFALGDYLLEQHRLNRTLDVIEVYGRVPFFYFVLHLFLAHLLVIPVGLLRAWQLHQPIPSLAAPPAWWGFSLPVVYLIWICVVAALYVPCLWFSRLKARRKDWWLSYL